jgi:hypothetical protein
MTSCFTGDGPSGALQPELSDAGRDLSDLRVSTCFTIACRVMEASRHDFDHSSSNISRKPHSSTENFRRSHCVSSISAASSKIFGGWASEYQRGSVRQERIRAN